MPILADNRRYQMKDDKIIERVRALLSMAGDASSPHEASIAAGRARKLMDVHQIELADLSDKSTGFGFRNVDQEYRFPPKWKDILVVAIAKYNDCVAIKTRKWKSTNNSYTFQLVFQGYESDVEVASAMYDYLTATVDRLCGKYISTLGYNRYPAKIGDAYKKAASNELCQRLGAMGKEREADVKMSDGRSLVLVKMHAVEAEFGVAKYSNVSLKSRQDRDVWDAQHQGRQDAKNIAINPMVKGQQQNVRIA
jgi:hypothetical protein